MEQEMVSNERKETERNIDGNITSEKAGSNHHRRNDILLIAFLLVIALLIAVGYRFLQGRETQNPVAVVSVDGKEYGRFPLDQDRQECIELSDGSYNILVIKDGVADMTEASCPDKICVDHRGISKKNESITCLPNKVVITIENGEESDLDMLQ